MKIIPTILAALLIATASCADPCPCEKHTPTTKRTHVTTTRPHKHTVTAAPRVKHTTPKIVAKASAPCDSVVRYVTVDRAVNVPYVVHDTVSVMKTTTVYLTSAPAKNTKTWVGVNAVVTDRSLIRNFGAFEGGARYKSVGARISLGGAEHFYRFTGDGLLFICPIAYLGGGVVVDNTRFANRFEYDVYRLRCGRPRFVGVGTLDYNTWGTLVRPSALIGVQSNAGKTNGFGPQVFGEARAIFLDGLKTEAEGRAGVRLIF